MSARTQVYCRPNPRRGDFRDARIDFRYCKMGRVDRRPKNHRSNVQKHMTSALREIRSGKFAREFIREMSTGRPRYATLLREAEKHPIEKVGARLRGLMAWKAKTKRTWRRCRTGQRAIISGEIVGIIISSSPDDA